jgi:hypothetical protein
MTRYLSLVFAGLLSLAVVAPAHAADDDGLDELQTKLGNEWVLVKNDLRRNIKTYAKQEDGKRFRSFKVEALIDNPLESAARVLLDADNYKKWYWEVEESYMLRRQSDTEYYIYLKHRAPYGLPDRDVILHAMVEPQSKARNYLTVKVRAAPDFIPEKPPLVRMPAEDMSVKFTPVTGNKVMVEAEGYVDPGGKVPTWANNYIQRNAPYSILMGLVRMMGTDTYRNSKTPVPFPIDNAP